MARKSTVPLPLRIEDMRTRVEICETFKVSEATVYRWQAKGLITGYKFAGGRAVRFDIREIAAMLADTPSTVRNQFTPSKPGQVA